MFAYQIHAFKDFDLHKVFELQIEKLQIRIESFTDDEIMANDLELLADNCYEEYYIEPLEIGSEEFGQRDIKQSKIKKWVDPFFRVRSQSEFVEVDGYIVTFYYTKLSLYLSKSYSNNLDDVVPVVPEPGQNAVELLIAQIQAIQKDLPDHTGVMSPNEQAFLEAAEEQYAMLGRRHRGNGK